MAAEEEEQISAGSRLHEEMRLSTSSGTVQSHGAHSGETLTRQETRSTRTASDPPEHTVTLLEMKDILSTSMSVPWEDVQLPIDILLLTVEECEFLACLSYLNRDYRRIYHEDLGDVYIGDMGKNEPRLRIAVMNSKMGSEGPRGSVVVVKTAVDLLNPKAVFSVGSCGGLNFNKVKLGDVAISTQVILYLPSIVTKDGIEECVIETFRVKRNLSKLIPNFMDGWNTPLKDPTELEVKIHPGMFLNSPKSDEHRYALMRRFPEAVAVEMEGEGLYVVAHDLDIEWITIKGVSDYADSRNSEANSWRQFASLMAASLTAHILSDPIVFQNWPHHESTIPKYVLDRGETATAAYRRAMELGETSDKRVKVLLIGQDRVGKTSVGRSLKGKKFKEDQSSTKGVQMDVALKNVGSEPWKNSIVEQEITAFDHKCALFISNDLSATSPELEVQSQDQGISEERAHLGPIEPSKASSANTPGIENPESKHEIQKVSLPEEKKPKVVIPDRIVRCVTKNLTKNRGDGDDGIWPVITDFAGQAIYRAIHPIFVSSEAIYVLMFDLTKNLHEIAQCHVREPGHGEIHIQAPDSNDTNLDHILRWMDLVHSFKHGDGVNILPPVILVGTKADLVANPHEIIRSVTDTICETSKVFIEHIKERIAVDNTRAGRPHDEEDPNVVKLRNVILKVGEEMPHTKKKVPLTWLQVENKVFELANKGENYITRQDFKMNICDDICQFETADDFEVLLLFLHDRGTVVYHGYASDPDCLVVLNPKWLNDILCQLITTEEQKEEPYPITRLRQHLGKSGVLEAALLDHSCEKLGVTNIKKSLLFIMKKFNLLCEYNGKDGNTINLVPCMLTSNPECNLESNTAENKGPAPVFLTFNTQYVPGGLFSRLIVLFVEFASRNTDSLQPDLHSNYARFFLGAVTGVEFVCYKRVIKVSIWNWNHQNSSSDPLDKEPKICSKLLRFLKKSLKKLQKECHWMRAVIWDLSARCDLCPTELVTETGECVWHRKQACRQEDCVHYVSLTKEPIVCSRTKGLHCSPPMAWSQALEGTLAFQALEKQPRLKRENVEEGDAEVNGKYEPTTNKPKREAGDIPSDKVLNKLSRGICTVWQSVGRELEVPQGKLDEISVSSLYPTPPDKAFQMLNAWKNRGKSVTYDELCRALKEHDLNELAESLRTF